MRVGLDRVVQRAHQRRRLVHRLYPAVWCAETHSFFAAAGPALFSPCAAGHRVAGFRRGRAGAGCQPVNGHRLACAVVPDSDFL